MITVTAGRLVPEEQQQPLKTLGLGQHMALGSRGMQQAAGAAAAPTAVQAVAVTVTVVLLGQDRRQELTASNSDIFRRCCAGVQSCRNYIIM
jgi:hypothetical protein